MSLTKEGLKAPPVSTTKVSVPEFGDAEHAYLRMLSIKGREDWERWCQEVGENGLSSAMDKFGGWRGYLLARTLCDEQGTLLFDDPAEAIEVIGDCPAGVMDRLYDEAIAFNGLSPDDADELEGDDDQAGNSEAAPSGDSP